MKTRTTILIPDDIHALLTATATANRRSVHAQMLYYIEAGLAAEETGTPAKRGTKTGGCPHPRARIHKGLCGACGTNVGTRAVPGY